jgi:hypothetical protein
MTFVRKEIIKTFHLASYWSDYTNIHERNDGSLSNEEIEAYGHIPTTSAIDDMKKDLNHFFSRVENMYNELLESNNTIEDIRIFISPVMAEDGHFKDAIEVIIDYQVEAEAEKQRKIDEERRNLERKERWELARLKAKYENNPSSQKA